MGFFNNMADDEKFQLVGRRKRGNRLPSVIANCNRIDKITESEFDIDLFTRKLDESKAELNASEYKKILFEKLNISTKILDVRNINDVVCYGLGHFSEHKHSRYQLALLLIIRDFFKANVRLYDPLFIAREIEFLESIDCRVIKENEEGKRRVESTTLIYLPHCPKQLMNNFLYANWGLDLSNCILVGNSFNLILESHTSSVLSNTASYIVRVAPFVKEIKLPNCFRYQNVFNDSAIHIFTKESLSAVPNAFWLDKEEPKYLEEDIEFIANSITKI